MTKSPAIGLISADARHLPLASDSVHCVVTSPPYWGLRAYGGDPGMIGLEPTFDEHLGNLVDVFREVRRVLRDDGTLWLNYGDAYWSGGSNNFGWKAKDLRGMPDLVATALMRDGYYRRSEIVWHKPNPMPESVTDRPTSSHEKVFLLTKKPRYFYDADAVREPGTTNEFHRTGNKAAWNGDRKDGNEGDKPGYAGSNLRNVWKIPTHSFPGAHFATFPPALAKRCILAGTSAAGVCADCGAPWVRQVDKALETDRKLSNPEDYEGYDSNNQGSNRVKDGHLRGTYEVKTTGWLPSCTCHAGRVPATVFDPFGGSGTVAEVATGLGRSAICVEINRDYIRLARERMNGKQTGLAI